MSGSWPALLPSVHSIESIQHKHARTQAQAMIQLGNTQELSLGRTTQRWPDATPPSSSNPNRESGHTQSRDAPEPSDLDPKTLGSNRSNEGTQRRRTRRSGTHKHTHTHEVSGALLECWPPFSTPGRKCRNSWRALPAPPAFPKLWWTPGGGGGMGATLSLPWLCVPFSCQNCMPLATREFHAGERM